MTKIRPPGTPRGENKSVTIANQQKQIAVLIDRCEELRGESDVNYSNANALINEINEAKAALDISNGLLAAEKLLNEDLRNSYTRLQGWQDCAREMLSGYPMFPAGITGA